MISCCYGRQPANSLTAWATGGLAIKRWTKPSANRWSKKRKRPNPVADGAAARAAHDQNPHLRTISHHEYIGSSGLHWPGQQPRKPSQPGDNRRSEEHTSELQSRGHLVCRLLLEKKNIHLPTV